MVSSTHRTAGCGPACPVVWQGRVGDHSPYADSAASLLFILEEERKDLGPFLPDGVKLIGFDPEGFEDGRGYLAHEYQPG